MPDFLTYNFDEAEFVRYGAQPEEWRDADSMPDETLSLLSRLWNICREPPLMADHLEPTLFVFTSAFYLSPQRLYLCNDLCATATK